MTRRAAPLLVDRLPLYATKAEISAAIVNSVGEQKFALSLFDWIDFPRSNSLFGGRYYVPAVLDFIDTYESGRAQAPAPASNERDAVWNTKAPRRRG